MTNIGNTIAILGNVFWTNGIVFLIIDHDASKVLMRFYFLNVVDNFTEQRHQSPEELNVPK